MSKCRALRVLSTGQQFRADLARLLAFTMEHTKLCDDLAATTKMKVRPGHQRVAVCDEFTSVVDRTVAKIGSSALAKTVRARKLRRP